MNADDKLEPAMAALEHDDPGQDVDVVVGLVGALPLPTDDLHLAAYSAVLPENHHRRPGGEPSRRARRGRASSHGAERGRGREKLVRARRRHRAEAVLLHELGHTLGALHESQVASLMHPSYDPKAGGYGDDADRPSCGSRSRRRGAPPSLASSSNTRPQRRRPAPGPRERPRAGADVSRGRIGESSSAASPGQGAATTTATSPRRPAA